jgi:hypothetical protein
MRKVKGGAGHWRPAHMLYSLSWQTRPSSLFNPGTVTWRPIPATREACRLVGHMTVIFGRRAGSRL